MRKSAIVFIIILAAILIIGCPGVGEDPGGEAAGSDTGLPVITLLGDNPFTIEINEDYVEPGYSASDDEDGSLTTEVEVTGTVNTSTVGIYTLYYNVSDTSGNEAAQVTRVINVENTTAKLDDVRIDVTVNYEYTGSGPEGANGTILLSLEPGGSVIAASSFDYDSDKAGTVIFNDPMVPFGENVYVEIYYDSDWSYSMTEGDSFYQYAGAVPVVCESVDIVFDDSNKYAADMLEIIGGWQALLSGGDELLYTFNNTNFSILVPTDSDPTYNDLSSTNSYGIVTVINNTEKYFIAQWAYHPEGNAYVGKYMKITWKDNDGIILDDMYWPYNTAQDAIVASTGSTSFSSSSQIF